MPSLLPRLAAGSDLGPPPCAGARPRPPGPVRPRVWPGSRLTPPRRRRPRLATGRGCPGASEPDGVCAVPPRPSSVRPPDAAQRGRGRCAPRREPSPAWHRRARRRCRYVTPSVRGSLSARLPAPARREGPPESPVAVAVGSGHRCGDGVFVGVAEADRPFPQPLIGRQSEGLPVKEQNGLATRSVDDLDFLPADLADARSERLRDRFLGGEARRQRRRRSGGIDQFLLGEEKQKETVAMAQNRLVDTLDLDHIDPGAHQADTPTRAGPATAIARRSGERNRCAVARIASRVIAATRPGYSM